MLSRAREARVRDALANHPPGTIQTQCLEHLAAARIPLGHGADLAAFVRGFQEHGDCQMQYGGVGDANGHETKQLLIWGLTTRPVAQDLTSWAAMEPTEPAVRHEYRDRGSR